MKISIHEMAAGSFVPMLERLAEVLLKGAEHAKSAKLDLVNARLAPDTFSLAHFYFHVVTAYDILRHNGSTSASRTI